MSALCKSPVRLGSTLLGFCLAGLLAGCGGDSVKTYQISGAATYQGQPIPKGYILFQPNTQAGNSGPGAQADIQNGRYSTMAGNGITGGPYLIRVYGFDGQPIDVGTDSNGSPVQSAMGRPLFSSYTFELDLPSEEAEQNLDVPAE